MTNETKPMFCGSDLRLRLIELSMGAIGHAGSAIKVIEYAHDLERFVLGDFLDARAGGAHEE